MQFQAAHSRQSVIEHKAVGAKPSREEFLRRGKRAHVVSMRSKQAAHGSEDCLIVVYENNEHDGHVSKSTCLLSSSHASGVEFAPDPEGESDPAANR